MNITPDQIKTKQIAGKTDDGNPVLYILTHGGLHAFFTKKEGKVEALAAAPHKGIAQWMADQKAKVKWDDDFILKGEGFVDSLQKSESAAFAGLREIVWSAPQEKVEKHENRFLVYDQVEKAIGVYSRDEILESIKKKELDGTEVVKELTLDKSATILSLSDDFGVWFK